MEPGYGFPWGNEGTKRHGGDVYKRQAVNRDYPEEEKGRNNHYSRKLKADLFIDDRNLGDVYKRQALLRFKLIISRLPFASSRISFTLSRTP